MLNIGILLAPLDAAQRAADLTTGDERLEEISQLSVDGEYLQAADRCQQLLESRHYDTRLVGYFLFGVFLEKGMAALPDILGAVHRCLGPNLAAFGPQAKRDVLLDSSLQWLFTSLLRQIERSEQLHDAAWQSLVEVKNLEPVRRMTTELAEISGLAAKLVKRPRAVQPIAHLEQVLKQAHAAIETSAESLRLSALSQMSAGAKKELKPGADAGDKDEDADAGDADFDTSDQEAAAEGEGEDEGDGAEEARASAEEDEGGEGAAEAEPETAADAARGAEGEDEGADAAEERPRAHSPRKEPRKPAARTQAPPEEPRRPAKAAERATVRAKDVQGGSITIEGSPALLQLVRRIQAFQTLCKRGELRKAAVVADSVLTTLDAFDPRVFFPSLFLPFFSLLSENAEEIEQAMSDRDSLTFKSLQQLMQVDISALLK
jgi:hypothetical protein